MKSPKGLSSIVVIGAIVGLIIASAMFFIFNNLQAKVSVVIGDGVYQTRLANTPDLREKGLSGITGLNQDQGLLMVFPSDDNWQIWMKDMKVPIDIIWLNKDKEVVYTVKDASPEDNPDAVYTPISKARYVLELPAGSAGNMSITTGSTAVFSVNDKDVK